MKKTIFEEMGGTYIIHGDYLIPCLTLPEEEQRFIGVWGQRHKRYLKEYRRDVYLNLLTSGRLNSYLVLKESSRFGELGGKKCPLEAGMTKKTVVKRGQYRSLLQILHRQSHHLQLKSNAYLINRNRSCF